jgi:putative ABC transport system ATP-binding protein
MTAAQPMVEARDVRFSFGATPALRGANVCIAAGEIVAVMGPSGSGKSTLLHCLAGILVPEAGEVRFAGQRLDDLPEGRRSALRRDRFGFVFQFGQLVPELTAAENIALPLMLSGTSRRGAVREARRWLAQLDLVEAAQKRPGELSGGEGQRVAVARALVHRPRVVFADEPTGSLDSLSGEVVMNLLVGMAADEGAAIVIVTHDPRVAAYARRDIIVRDGKIVTPVAA